MITAILVFLALLSILVLIHELGHFLVAKRLGIKVEEFGFGFPPRLFGKKKGETMYSVNALPFGGFVKLYGEDEAGGGKLKVKSEKFKVDEVKDLKRAFFARAAHERASVVVAGVVMNVLLAAVIFYVYLGISGFRAEIPLVYPYHFFGVSETTTSEVVISGVAKDGPAAAAGISPFSKVIAVNGVSVMNGKSLVDTINKNKGKVITLAWQDLKTKKTQTATLTPRQNPPKNEGPLGIALFSNTTAILSYDTVPQKLFSGFVHPLNLTAYNMSIMAKLIAVSFREHSAAPVSEGVSGPVGIYSLVGNIIQIPDARERLLQVLNLAGILSMSLAFFNILPIPALDGGRFFFILIELATGKRVHPRFEGLAHAVGMAVLFGLIILITINDIGKLFSGGTP